MKQKQNKINAMLAIILLAAISLFASCNKDENENNFDPQCLISKMNDAWVEDCDGEKDSIIRQISFSYNADDLLSKWGWDSGDYNLFEYSNGKLAKIEEHWNEEVNNLHFTWDGNKVTRQSYLGDEPGISKSIIELNSNNEIVRVDGYYKYSGEWVLDWYEIFTWQSGNIVKIEEYSLVEEQSEKSAKIERRDVSGIGILSNIHLPKQENVRNSLLKSTCSNYELVLTTTYTHDDKNNPFHMQQALGLWNPWSPLFQSKNNVVSWTKVESNNVEEEIWSATMQIEYNTQNFPGKIIIIVDNDDECYSEETIEFSYENCGG
ncbi:MAG: hypothetical protein JW842_04295 [Prolixibacteraceae bacterium]|nr:hypothetical protein [Prolixibacteraceae bacterium]